MPHFIGSIIAGLGKDAARAHQDNAFGLKGTIWEGSPISDKLVGKAHASEYTPPTQTNTGGSTNVTPGGYNDTNNLYNTAPSGGGGGSTGGSTGGGGVPYAPTFDGQTVSIDGRTYRSQNGQWVQVGGGDDGSQRIRDAINSGYNSVFAGLDQMASNIPNQSNQLQGQVTGMFNTGVEGLGLQRDQSLQGLDQGRQEVRENKATTLRDLASDLRNQLLAGSIYLGAQGAGDSSATGRLSGALAKAANRNSATVMSGADKAMNDIFIQEQQVNNTFNQEKNNLESWKNEQILGITQWAQNMLNNIQSQKVTATGEKAAALANLEQNIYQNAVNRLYQLQDQATSYAQSLNNWVLEKTGSIDAAKKQLAQFGQFSAPQFSAGSLPGIQTGGLPATNPTAFNPNARDDEFFGPNPFGQQDDRFTV